MRNLLVLMFSVLCITATGQLTGQWRGQYYVKDGACTCTGQVMAGVMARGVAATIYLQYLNTHCTPIACRCCRFPTLVGTYHDNHLLMGSQGTQCHSLASRVNQNNGCLSLCQYEGKVNATTLLLHCIEPEAKVQFVLRR